MRKIFSRSIAKIVTILSLTSLVQAAQFRLPNGTPGRQEIVDPGGNVLPMFACIDEENYEHVVVPNTTCNLYFPIDGSQPTTEKAGEYSGARFVDQPGDNLVTDWWVRVFGGNNAVALSQDRWFIFFDWSAKFGVDEHGKQSHIIQMNTTSNVPKNFEKQFWQTFRQIAADPVGRVLLYRLLIEIRRVNNDRNECEENGSLRESTTNKKCLSIEINPANECKFKIVPQKSKAEISFNSAKITTFVLGVNNNFLSTKEKDRGADVGLFHEMLHWFHYLRKHQRVLDNKSGNPRDFKYVLRCYYGNQTELCVWGLICNVEEIATILGSPNYSNQEHLDLICNNAFLPNQNDRRSLIEISQNQYIPKADKFLNGDDLSENVYRASKRLPMRFGHVNISINNFCILRHPHRFKLAHRVAFYCYYEITGNILEDWNYAIGEAISR